MKEDAARPRVNSRGIDSGGTAVREDAARPGRVASKVGGSCETGSGQPASQSQTGACRSCGLAGVSHAAGMWNRPGRKTHSDRLVRTQRKALRPRCPADEAINPNRKTNVQRKKRSTPTARPVPSGRRTNVNFNRRTELRTKDQGQLRRFGPRCLRRTNVKLRSDSIPSWATLWSTRATGITHPGFYGRKPWRKPNNASIITAAGTAAVCLTRDIAGIVRFSSCLVTQKFTFSAGNTRHWPPVTSTTVRR